MAFKVLHKRRHQGVDFVEVVQLTEDPNRPATAGPVHYALPGTYEPGTILEVEVKIVAEQPGLTVTDSPVTDPQPPPPLSDDLADTAPSGQQQTDDSQIVEQQEEVKEVNTKKDTKTKKK